MSKDEDDDSDVIDLSNDFFAKKKKKKWKPPPREEVKIIVPDATAPDFEHPKTPPKEVEIVNKTPEVEDDWLKLRRMTKYWFGDFDDEIAKMLEFKFQKFNP